MNRNISPFFALFFLLLNACGSGPTDQSGDIVTPSDGPVKSDDPSSPHGSVFLGLHFSGDLPPFADHLNWEAGGFKGSFVAKAKYPLILKKGGSINVRLAFDTPPDIQRKEIFFACKDAAGTWLTSVVDDSKFKVSGLLIEGKFEIPFIGCVPDSAALLHFDIIRTEERDFQVLIGLGGEPSFIDHPFCDKARARAANVFDFFEGKTFDAEKYRTYGRVPFVTEAEPRRIIAWHSCSRYVSLKQER